MIELGIPYGCAEGSAMGSDETMMLLSCPEGENSDSR
jgi:hypothetical protein